MVDWIIDTKEGKGIVKKLLVVKLCKTKIGSPYVSPIKAITVEEWEDENFWRNVAEGEYAFQPICFVPKKNKYVHCRLLWKATVEKKENLKIIRFFEKKEKKHLIYKDKPSFEKTIRIR